MVRLQWRPPVEHGIIRGYNIDYYVFNDDNVELLGDEVHGSRNYVTINDLSPDTMYQFTVAAFTRRGDGIRSRPAVIRTDSEGGTDSSSIIQDGQACTEMIWAVQKLSVQKRKDS